MVNVIIQENKTFTWFNSGKYYFIGYVFDDHDTLLIEQQAIDYLTKYPLNKSIAIGLYTLIEINEKAINIFTDSINYFPVFYYFDSGIWVLSNSFDKIITHKGEFNPNSDAEQEFLMGGFVLGSESLDKNIKRTQAGEKLVLTPDGKIQKHNVWFFSDSDKNESNYSELITETKTQIDNSAKRMIKFLNGRTVVLPLSGGFDSRLIACMLKQYNYNNVVCFTYGQYNAEVPISKKVAETLGYQWYFIDYKDLKITDFQKEKDFIQYFSNAGNGFAMPYLQEYFAVKELKKRNLIPEDSVFLPGHSGDFLGGSYVKKTVKTKTQVANLHKHILKKYFVFSNLKNSALIEKRISNNLKQYECKTDSHITYKTIIEDWDVKEKLSKFIFNSSLVFNYFGHQHYFPLWDTQLVKYFSSIDYKYRENKMLYDETLILNYFKPFGVYFESDELSVSSFKKSIQKTKDFLRRLVPWKIVYKRMLKTDWIYYSAFCSELEKEMIYKGQPKIKNYKYFNAVICKYYLFWLGFYNKD